ncbi:KpsF/GutQ family sugar-phosphate isomerase [Comamonas endophytica]|uniref:KpsF/GutQ family sugar-phosphate isomerase n=1 Tax=Comamonas endophytica TaxID=2949090 RepID=A0ABY6G6G0_9BURK|nr:MULTISPECIES: KpsF/GutQ family sugar-phosphate isomerase [unclassified Acidovorax]MCD2512375.1 KpsF/GutQ family sugar-phosphate isomerase [Acidovorax sp. D4N7]UYG50177.1 KpsF/GutQ family sugar-phosphate isomerase [Acidovorax sp. 5MLIR]
MNSASASARAFDGPQALQLARDTLGIEAQALLALSDRLSPVFARVVERILEIQGRVVVMGMGKSGHVGRKIAATLASTGTPSFFVHPGEASHGDLGMVTEKDLVLALSNSGESDEIAALLPALRRQGVPVVGMTGNARSTLARHADWVLDTYVEREACPLNLAPTASTTAQLALGDALAVALLDARGFKAEDFARSHPGGALGRKLLTHVGDVMRSGSDVPRVPADAPFLLLMREMSAKGLGASAVVGADGRLLGVFTDGDLRRRIERGADLLSTTAGEVMHAKPHTIEARALAVDAARLMEQHGITSVLVVEGTDELVGVVHIRDLMRAKVI